MYTKATYCHPSLRVWALYNGGMDWHARYIQQARWTEQLRSYLFDKAGLNSARRILEAGCGTGALLIDFPSKHELHGLDVSLAALSQAARHAPGVNLSAGDGTCLPYSSSVFDIVFCHYLLLWTADPGQVVSEMRRVTRPGGAVLALAEPDYGGRIDYPSGLAELGHRQQKALREQGADPELGRKLAGIFHSSGLRQVETGILGAQWQDDSADSGPGLEWQVLAEDLPEQVAGEDFQRLKALDGQARARGERVLYVPTFYAWGVV